MGYLSLTERRDEYRPWIGAVFIAASVLWIVHYLAEATGLVRRVIKQRRQVRTAKKQLDHLSPDERTCLRGYIEDQSKTKHLDYTNGVVVGLVKAGVRYIASTRTVLPNRCDINMAQWAWKHLNEHPDLVGLPGAKDR